MSEHFGPPTRWFSLNGPNGNACVEIAVLPDGIAVRDSKDPSGPVLRFTIQECSAFLAGARADELPVG